MEYSRFFYTSITYKSTPDPAIFHIPNCFEIISVIEGNDTPVRSGNRGEIPVFGQLCRTVFLVSCTRFRRQMTNFGPNKSASIGIRLRHERLLVFRQKLITVSIPRNDGNDLRSDQRIVYFDGILPMRIVRIENMDFPACRYEFAVMTREAERINIRFGFYTHTSTFNRIHLFILAVDIVRPQIPGFIRKILVVEKITPQARTHIIVGNSPDRTGDDAARIEEPAESHVTGLNIRHIAVRSVIQHDRQRKILVLISVKRNRRRYSTGIEVRSAASVFEETPNLRSSGIEVVPDTARRQIIRNNRIVLRIAESPDTQQASDGQ